MRSANKIRLKGKVASRDALTDALTLMYTKTKLSHAKNQMRLVRANRARVSMTVRDHKLLRDLDDRIVETLRRRDRQAKRGEGRGWKSAIEREHMAKTRKILRRVIVVLTP